MEKQTDRKALRMVELFAGVGGFRLGLECAAPEVFQTIWANQWEPGQKGQWAYRCYTAHFGPNHHCVNADIVTVASDVPDHDFLVGGFPCQDFSAAKPAAKGLGGTKGALWWTIDTIINRCQPAYILLENVDRLLRSPSRQRGRDFGIMLKCLDMAGYTAEWRVINAADYGCCQRRRRTFLFAFRDATPFSQRFLKCGKNGYKWLHHEGLFAAAFPVQEQEDSKESANLHDCGNLSEMFAQFQMTFLSGGVMSGGEIRTEALSPVPCNVRLNLEDAVERNPIEARFFLRDEDLPRWMYLKGPKKIDRVSASGHFYRFTEGGIAFPDPLDRPARTMLTSESTLNRSACGS